MYCPYCGKEIREVENTERNKSLSNKNNKIKWWVSREWLIFLSSFIPVGILFLIILLIGNHLSGWSFQDTEVTIKIWFSIYIFVLLVRSIVWSIKNIKTRNKVKPSDTSNVP